MNMSQVEGNVNSCLDSRGRSSNKSHEEYDAEEESLILLISNNKNETLVIFCLVWMNLIFEVQ